MPTIGERIGSLYQSVFRGSRLKTPEEVPTNRVMSMQERLAYTAPFSVDNGNLYKAVIPQWFYKPPWGLPLNKDVVEIRRLGATPYVTIVKNTIAHEVAGLDWDVRVEEGAVVPDEVVQKTIKWLYNPNRNDESLGYIFQQIIADSIELDAAVIEKVYTLKGELSEIYARDGGLFTKNPDVHGVLPDERSYWQYSWTIGTPPIPFNRPDIVYMIRNPRTDTVYGRGEVETLYSTLRMLLYGIENSLEYYTETQTASGVLKLAGATPEEVERFKIQWNESMRRFDAGGNSRRAVFKKPVVNADVEFIKTGFDNEELQLIEQQQWFSKLVWACFGASPSELGFTDDVNRASAVMESASFKRKILRPFTMMIEYYFNTEIINDLPWIKGKYEDMVHFEFDRADMGLEKVKREVLWKDYELGIITRNQFLEKIGESTVPDGNVRYTDSRSTVFSGDDTLNTISDYMGEERKQDESLNDDGVNVSSEEKAVYLNSFSYDLKALDSSTPLVIRDFEELSKHIDDIDFDFDDVIKKINDKHEKVEEKGIVDVGMLVTGLIGLVNFSRVNDKLGVAIRDGYSRGLDFAGVKTNQNFVPDAHVLGFLERYAGDNIKSLGADTMKKLRTVLMADYQHNRSVEDTRSHVEDVLNASRSRAKMIVATEMARAVNAGKLQGFRDSGLKGKVEWKAQDNVAPGHSCYSLDGKKVPVGGLFKSKDFVGHGPPAHPNCVCTLEFKPEE